MIHGMIRPEAQPTSWDILNLGQQEAIRSLLKIVKESLELLEKEKQSDYRSPYFSDVRASRIAFLDGQRGTGKSTVLITFLKALKTGELNNAPSDIEELIKQLSSRVVLLEAIDMEPVPKDWNMLPAILVRIGEAYNRFSASKESNPLGLLEPTSHYHDAWTRLNLLQNNIALSWDGNLSDRAGQIDPDTYAQETIRNETARLHLNPEFRTTLDQLAKQISQCSHIENPIFLLPIDDFDLNPTACLEMLRILRMISVPRLFNLVLGDLDVVDIVLNLKQSSNLPLFTPTRIKKCFRFYPMRWVR